ncbi:MAG: cache domain-containing protein, partial [Aristaeellaceae bacterium]
MNGSEVHRGSKAIDPGGKRRLFPPLHKGERAGEKVQRTASYGVSHLVRTQVSIIVALVALILSVYAVHTAINVQNTIDRNNSQMLASFSEDADEHVVAFAENFLQLYVLGNSDIAGTFRRGFDEITMNRISGLCDTLHSYLLTNQLFHSIYVYYLQSNMVVSTNGVYILGDSGAAREDIDWIAGREFTGRCSWRVMNDYKLHYTVPSSYACDVLSLVQKYPVRSRDHQYTGYVAVNLSAEQVYKTAVTQNVTEDSFFLIADADGRILKNPDAPETLAAADLSGLMTEGSHSFSLSGEKYTVLCRETIHGMRYMNFVPTSVYWDELRSTMLLAVMIALAAMIAPAVASSMVIERIYSP